MLYRQVRTSPFDIVWSSVHVSAAFVTKENLLMISLSAYKRRLGSGVSASSGAIVLSPAAICSHLGVSLRQLHAR